MSKTTTEPAKWHKIYRDNEDKCFFVGKDGKSGLARSEYDWRTTDSLSRESGLTKRECEEILDFYAKKGVVIQHSGGEKWGYWERVGVPKSETDPIAKDHQDRTDRQVAVNGGAKKPTLPGGTSVIAAPAPAPGTAPAPAPGTGTTGAPKAPAKKPVTGTSGGNAGIGAPISAKPAVKKPVATP
jgi:hypothetical protein